MDKLIFILLQAEYDTTSHVIKVKKGKEVPSIGLGEYEKLEMVSSH